MSDPHNPLTAMTHAAFAMRCSNIASQSAAWSRDTLAVDSPNKPVDEWAARRFLSDIRQLLDFLEEGLTL